MRLLNWMALLVMLIAGGSVSAQDELTLTYISADGSFSFRYPERASINDFWQNNRLVAIDNYQDALISIQILDPANLIIGMPALPIVSTNATLPEVYEVYVEQFEVRREVKVEETMFGTHPAIYALWETAGVGDVIILLFQLENGSFVRAVNFSQHPEDYSDLLMQVAETIVYEPVSTALNDNLATTITSQQEGHRFSDPSPDFQWFANVTRYGCTTIEGYGELAYEYLRLIPAGDGEPVEIAKQLYSCEGTGVFGLQVLFWSENNRYFYYTDAREGVPENQCPLMFWERPILRVEVSSTNTTILGGGSISPDGRLLATWTGNEILLNDVNEGELARFPLYDPEKTLSMMFWLPDSSGVIYVLSDTDCAPATQSIMFFISVADLQQSVIFETGQ